MSVPSFLFSLGGNALVNAVAAVVGKALPIGRDLALDPETNDLLLVQGDLTLVNDLDAIKQEVDIRLRFMLGEWFLDTEAGVPYFQQILVKSPNTSAIRSVFAAEILSVAGIRSLISLKLDFNRSTRVLKVTWVADTDLGELESTLEF